MEKKKLKLSISGSSKKTFNSIEQAKSQSRNTVVIEKKGSRFGNKPNYPRPNQNKNANVKSGFVPKINKPLNQKPSFSASSDFEKRKLAEQRATRRLKGETQEKDIKQNKINNKRRELK